jgi:methanogenic corrinoid protein MtbC1
MKAVEDFDAEYLQFILARGAATRGLKALIETVIVPLLSIIGQRWEQGTMRVGQEHLASSVIRTYLEQTLHSIAPQNSSSRILVTTPSGQLHELGALMAGVYASLEGWNVIYLGANTPSKDIVEVAQNANVSAIALSIVCPEQDQGLTMELRDIRRGVGPKMPVFVGGRAARCYEVILKEIGSQRLSDLKMFGALLNKVDLVSI